MKTWPNVQSSMEPWFSFMLKGNGRPGVKLGVRLGRASKRTKNGEKLTKCHSKLLESEMKYFGQDTSFLFIALFTVYPFFPSFLFTFIVTFE